MWQPYDDDCRELIEKLDENGLLAISLDVTGSLNAPLGKSKTWSQLSIHILCLCDLYMDDHHRWFEHGDQFDDHIPTNSIVKVVRLNKSQELDKRYL